MHAKEIAHVPVTTIPKDAVSEQLVNDSTRLLGYNPKHARVTGQLSRVLAKLDIEPLNRRHVETYKRSKAYRGMSNITRIFLIGVFVLLATSITMILRHVPGYWWGIYGGVAAVSFIVFGVNVDTMKSKRRVSNWAQVPLSRYSGFVPMHVLNKAIQIKSELPQVQFNVDVLETNWEEKYPDPFLIATHGNELFYIEVWDEIEFEALTRTLIA